MTEGLQMDSVSWQKDFQMDSISWQKDFQKDCYLLDLLVLSDEEVRTLTCGVYKLKLSPLLDLYISRYPKKQTRVLVFIYM